MSRNPSMPATQMRQTDAACDCTQGPDYEGPCSWCDVHGQPSAAWTQGLTEGRRQEREVVSLELTQLRAERETAADDFELIGRLETQADISTRPGQYSELISIAHGVRLLNAELERLRKDQAEDDEARMELAREIDRLRARDRQSMAAVREALRLLDDWQTAEELGTVEEWANQIGDTLERLTEGHP